MAPPRPDTGRNTSSNRGYGFQKRERPSEEQLLVYNRALSLVAQHLLCQAVMREPRLDPAHAPPKDLEEQLARLRERYAELGPVGSQFLEGILAKQRYGKHDAQRVLSLLQAYSQPDILAAMNRAIQYHAYGYQSLERILAHFGTPKPAWQILSDKEQEALSRLAEEKRIGPRRSEDYQRLLETPPPEPLSPKPSHDQEADPPPEPPAAQPPAEFPGGSEPA